jgi:hypothetical protein
VLPDVPCHYGGTHTAIGHGVSCKHNHVLVQKETWNHPTLVVAIVQELDNNLRFSFYATLCKCDRDYAGSSNTTVGDGPRLAKSVAVRDGL